MHTLTVMTCRITALRVERPEMFSKASLGTIIIIIIYKYSTFTIPYCSSIAFSEKRQVIICVCVACETVITFMPFIKKILNYAPNILYYSYHTIKISYLSKKIHSNKFDLKLIKYNSVILLQQFYLRSSE